MTKQKYCKECGVPKLVYKELTWQDNGIITETKNPDHRMLFSETENLDGLFTEIERSIGMPIDKLVVESKRRVAREYIENMIPPVILKLLFTFTPGLIVKRMTDIAKAHGYGNIQSTMVKKNTDEGVYKTSYIENPYCLLFYRGDQLGGFEAGTGLECTSKITGVAADKYLLEFWSGEHPPELEERMKQREYPIKDGNTGLERCPKCNIPLAVGAYDFDLDRGTTINPENGTRMAIFGPVGLEAVFTALEEELGETIPETIIEAQTRYARENFRVSDWVAGEEHLRHMIAIRGYGMLTDYEADQEHFLVKIQNPVVIPLMVGMAKGIFERALKVDSSVHKWSVSEDGELSIEIRKKG